MITGSVQHFLYSAAIKTFIGAGIYAAVGVVYGALFKTSKMVTAQVFAMHNTAGLVVRASILYTVGGDRGEHPRLFNILNALATATIDTIAYIAYRRLNLIGTLGTIAFSACTLCLFACYLNDAFNPVPPIESRMAINRKHLLKI